MEHNSNIKCEIDLITANKQLLEIYTSNKTSYPRCDGTRVYYNTKSLNRRNNRKFD